MAETKVTIHFDEAAPQGFSGAQLERAINIALERGGFYAAKVEIDMETVQMADTLKSIQDECRLHAEGPHDKTGNMLSIGMWAAKALD